MIFLICMFMEITMFNLILDIIIYNYTPYLSYFFLLNIHNKNYIYNLSIALFIDIFITHTYILNTIFITIYFILRKMLKINNIFKYYLFNISIILMYFIILNNITLISVLNVFLINSIYILISYKNKWYSINLSR